jgi:hypothetical protein
MTSKSIPRFNVTVTLDELIRAEMLLVMLGYDKPDQEWNNKQVKDHVNPPKSIITFTDDGLLYLFFRQENSLPASNLEAIERYVMEGGVK